MKEKIALIIGAGPAGLTAAYELLRKTDIIPIICETTDSIGGICRTIEYKGNRMDMGGHRFFSKSERVINWWLNILPLQRISNEEKAKLKLSYHGMMRELYIYRDGPDPKATDKVMLVRRRKSRIYYSGEFYDYPLSVNYQTLKNFGLIRTIRVLTSYLKSKINPIKDEKSLKDFIINRFGMELYNQFFKTYTEKVWGIPCDQISAEWGAQRIKSLSLAKTVAHFFKNIFPRNRTFSQSGTQTSLIEMFLYPKYGPGQMWEEVAMAIEENGGKIYRRHRADMMTIRDSGIVKVAIKNLRGGEDIEIEPDYVFSTMPVKELIANIYPTPPEDIAEVAKGLVYRDFVTVGVLVKKFEIKENHKPTNGLIDDNWVYIHEPGVKVGRIQIYNNWSESLVKDPGTVWLGLEYFCSDDDEVWKMTDEELIEMAADELCFMKMIDKADVIDSAVERVPKAYPAYFGTYDRFYKIREFVNGINNLFLIGRNGLHRYNNQDHSMLTAMTAVDNICEGRQSKDNIWQINTEDEYQEEIRKEK